MNPTSNEKVYLKTHVLAKFSLYARRKRAVLYFARKQVFCRQSPFGKWLFQAAKNISRHVAAKRAILRRVGAEALLVLLAENGSSGASASMDDAFTSFYARKCVKIFEMAGEKAKNQKSGKPGMALKSLCKIVANSNWKVLWVSVRS